MRADVSDERVLEAIAAVPRDVFVEARDQRRAWDNQALPIGAGQTISQPLVVARMCELLELSGDELVLDVGTGSGYHAAVLARLAREVLSIEVHEELAQEAARRLIRSGVTNVRCFVGDGSHGLPQHAPFDAINVAAATTEQRLDPLLAQLRPGGRLVAPVTIGAEDQQLIVVRSLTGGTLDRSAHEHVRFVPLLGDAGPG